jgi:hypothetical protein
MRIFLLFIVLIFITTCFSCHSTGKRKEIKNIVADTIKNDSTKKIGSYATINQDSSKIGSPIVGYRFIITGDFNGDHKIDTLVEHYYDGNTHKETYKFNDSTDYDELVGLASTKDPVSFVTSSNGSIDTLYVANTSQLFGLSYLKNEGDLNGDGTDELSYVVDWADWSNLNTWHIMTYKNHRWKELYSFPIWDWQIPDLPESSTQYGLFGTVGKTITDSTDTINNNTIKDLQNFAGLVKKIATNKIQIDCNVRGDEDTLIIDLRHPRKIKE